MLGNPGTVEVFLRRASQRLGGDLLPGRQPAVFSFNPGQAAPALRARSGKSFPLAVTLDRQAAPVPRDRQTDRRAEYVGRTHPLVEGLADLVLGRALGGDPDPLFARAGAIFTRAVARRTAVALLRIRYRMRDLGEGFAEEVLLAAFSRGTDGLTWLTPIEQAGRDLLEAAEPAANMSSAERTEHVRWALGERLN